MTNPWHDPSQFNVGNDGCIILFRLFEENDDGTVGGKEKNEKKGTRLKKSPDANSKSIFETFFLIKTSDLLVGVGHAMGVVKDCQGAIYFFEPNKGLYKSTSTLEFCRFFYDLMTQRFGYQDSVVIEISSFTINHKNSILENKDGTWTIKNNLPNHVFGGAPIKNDMCDTLEKSPAHLFA